MLKKLKVSRRMALKGVLSGVGVSMWLPILDAMTDDNGEAFAQGDALPTTYGIFFWANGVQPPDWAPGGAGADWTLPRNLQAFESLKSHFTLVNGLDMLDGGFRGHGCGMRYSVCGGNGLPATTAKDTFKEQDPKSDHPNTFEGSQASQLVPTVDQLVANHLEKTDPTIPFKSVQTGTLKWSSSDYHSIGTLSTHLSHAGPYQTFPAERDPVKLYDKLFSLGTAPDGSASQILSQMQRSSLDAVKDDLNRVTAQVGAVDRARIERHVEGVRAIETRLDAFMPGASCVPDRPTLVAPVDDLMLIVDRTHVLNRLLAAALGCNLTRVYSHQWAGLRDNNVYPLLDIGVEHHTLTHEGPEQNKVASDVERLIMENYADLALAMSEIEVGAGTVLDNTLCLGLTDQADPATHLHTNYHVPIIGKAGGKIKGNQFVNAGGRKLTQLHLTALNVMGLGLENFGSWDSTSEEMTELLT